MISKLVGNLAYLDSAVKATSAADCQGLVQLGPRVARPYRVNRDEDAAEVFDEPVGNGGLCRRARDCAGGGERIALHYASSGELAPLIVPGCHWRALPADLASDEQAQRYNRTWLRRH